MAGSVKWVISMALGDVRTVVNIPISWHRGNPYASKYIQLSHMRILGSPPSTAAQRR